MKINVRVILLIAAAFLIVPAMALAAAPAEPGKPGAPPTPLMGPMPAQQHPLANLPAFKDEMTRHQEAVKTIMAPLKDIRTKMAADIKALREKYFPKPAEGEKRVPPTPETVQEFIAKIREIVTKYQNDNEAVLKAAAGKMFDERILHQQNVIKIEQANKDAIVNAHWRNLLNPARFFQNMRERLQQRRMMHPVAPPPAGAPGPSTAPPAPVK
jgi:nitrate/nitrite-specific signal transduction histidine kinase